MEGRPKLPFTRPCKYCEKQVACNMTFHKGFKGESLKNPTEMINGNYHFCSLKCLKLWGEENVKPEEDTKSGDARYFRFDCGGVI